MTLRSGAARTADDLPPANQGPVDRPTGPRRRWPIGATVALVAGAGFMAGAGVTPGAAVDAVTGWFEAEPAIDTVAAGVVAIDEDGAVRVEAWFGPTVDAAGECEFVRTLTASGGIVDGATRCVDGVLLPWSDPDFVLRTNSQYFGFVRETPIGTADTGFESVALTGAVHPSVTAVTADFGDGAEYSFVPDPRTGWFAIVLPETIADPSREDGRLVNALVALRLFDTEGRALTTVDVPAWRSATGRR